MEEKGKGLRKAPCIYIGPTNKGIGLIQYTIYTEKPERLIGVLKEKIPLISYLFVRADEFWEAAGAMTQTETVEAKAARQVNQA